MRDLPQRLRWFSDLLHARRGDRILEVGCGNGALLELLAARRPHGLLVGIDRSALQVQRATQRLARLPAPPRVHCLALEAAGAHLAADFTRIIAMNVNVPWIAPAAAGTALRGLLAPRGRVLLGFEPPTPRVAARLMRELERAATLAGFTQGDVHRDEASRTFAVEWR